MPVPTDQADIAGLCLWVLVSGGRCVSGRRGTGMIRRTGEVEDAGSLESLNEYVPIMLQLRRFADRSLPEPSELLCFTSTGISESTPPGWAHKQLAGHAPASGCHRIQPARSGESRVEVPRRALARIAGQQVGKIPAGWGDWLVG